MIPISDLMKGKSMTEFEKLVKMMDDAAIPYERNDDVYTYFDKEPIKRIKYPKKGVDEVCSVVYGYGTYGYPQGLLEICGLLTDEEAEYDSIAGCLTAEDVFSRIKADYEKKVASAMRAIPESFVVDFDNPDGSATHLYCPKAPTLEEAIKAIEGMKRGIFPWYSEKYLDLAIKALKQKTGKWIKVDDEEPIAYDCSECGMMFSKRFKYCPNCGAKMEESEENHDN